MSLMAQLRHGVKVELLPTSTRGSYETLYGEANGQRQQDAFEERIQENMVTPIPDQVAFRIDFPAWLRTLTVRERRIIRAMLLNEQTKNLSRKFHVSPAKISQLRRAFECGWTKSTADSAEKPMMA